MKKNLILILLVISFPIIGFAQPKNDAGIEEKLGNTLPLDARFMNSKGEEVSLKSMLGKPVLLALVYYECPGICSPMLTDLSWVIEKVELKPKKDFEVITLSFDPHENPKIASRWKKNYFDGMKGKFPKDSWYFLTGDSANIKKITDAAGFYFIPSEDEFVHAGAVIAISPEGKISRYLYGTTFNPFDVKMALLDAKAGKTNPTITKILQFCFSYDPEGRSYVLNITRIAGTFILLVIGIFITVLLWKKKKVKSTKGAVIDG